MRTTALLDDAFTVLQWKGDHDEGALDEAESAYMSLVAGELGARLRELETENLDLAREILDLLTESDAATLRRVVLAPETSARILWEHPGRCDDRSLWHYVRDAMIVEIAVSDRRPPDASSISPALRWTALGDARLDTEADCVVAQPTMAGLVVDTESPYATCFDYSSLSLGDMELRHYEDSADKGIALGRVEAAMRGIEAVDRPLADFVRRFTLVANILVDLGTAKFTSGSSGLYIGRSLFCNAHLPSADVELLAESLVHEATHSLLYMYEVLDPWVLTDELLDKETTVTSPWSGADLVLRPFLQACFVWFALVHFWSLPADSAPFRRERVEANLARARRGFLSGPLLDRISDYAPNVSPNVLELVRAMQEDVIADATAPATHSVLQ